MSAQKLSSFCVLIIFYSSNNNKNNLEKKKSKMRLAGAFSTRTKESVI
jgi:hypothetical protein